MLIILIKQSLILISVDPDVPVIINPGSSFELIINIILLIDNVPLITENFPFVSINRSDFILVV
jgi:hypothetical protein